MEFFLMVKLLINSWEFSEKKITEMQINYYQYNR